MDSILECKGLSKHFGKKQALSDFSIEVEKGKIVGLLGPNGSGKTTLLKLITGLLTATKGELLIDGQPLNEESLHDISFLPERSYLSDWMNVCDVLDFFCDFYSNFNRIKAEAMLDSLNILKDESLKTMSKGTKEKVQLIMVMARDAKLYLLDEPIGGVDPAARDFILDTIIKNYNENATVIISTHLIQDVENLLDEAIFIKNGSLVFFKSVDDIRQQHAKSVDEVFREVFKC